MLRLERGKFGLMDQSHLKLNATQKLKCELTLRDGRVVYDLNGMSRELWDKVPADYRSDPKWDGFASQPRPAGQRPPR